MQGHGYSAHQRLYDIACETLYVEYIDLFTEFLEGRHE